MLRVAPLRSRRLILIGLDWVRTKDPPLSLANASIAAACSSVADVSTLVLNVNQPTVDLHHEISGRLSELTAHDKEPPIVAVEATCGQSTY